MTTKLNQDIELKRSKNKWSILPWSMLDLILAAFMYGANKYEENNWKKLNSVDYFDAMMRHLREIEKGNWFDESKLPHIAHLMASCIMYSWLKRKELLVK